jgi:hypothetical protein
MWAVCVSVSVGVCVGGGARVHASVAPWLFLSTSKLNRLRDHNW